MYHLLIRRYGRSMNFDSLEDLKQELEQYFTIRESTLVKRLCTFQGKPDPETGAITNRYRDFSVSYYPDII